MQGYRRACANRLARAASPLAARVAAALLTPSCLPNRSKSRRNPSVSTSETHRRQEKTLLIAPISDGSPVNALGILHDFTAGNSYITFRQRQSRCGSPQSGRPSRSTDAKPTQVLAVEHDDRTDYGTGTALLRMPKDVTQKERWVFEAVAGVMTNEFLRRLSVSTLKERAALGRDIVCRQLIKDDTRWTASPWPTSWLRSSSRVVS